MTCYTASANISAEGVVPSEPFLFDSTTRINPNYHRVNQHNLFVIELSPRMKLSPTIYVKNKNKDAA